MYDTPVLFTERDHGMEADESDLIRAAGEDPVAFGELYERYLNRVYRYLRTRTETREDAVDLTQRVFLQALRAMPRYQDRGLPFAAWLFRIARNVATNFYTRRPDTLSWDLLPETLQPPAEGPEDTVLRREALERLRVLLSGVGMDKRELLALYFSAGLTQREIASVVGKSEAAVQKQLSRTLHELKERYSGT